MFGNSIDVSGHSTVTAGDDRKGKAVAVNADKPRDSVDARVDMDSEQQNPGMLPNLAGWIFVII